MLRNLAGNVKPRRHERDYSRASPSVDAWLHVAADVMATGVRIGHLTRRVGSVGVGWISFRGRAVLA